MIKKSCSLILALTLIFAHPMIAHAAGQAVILSDSELDQVYAGNIGLFDSNLSNIPSNLISNAPNANIQELNSSGPFVISSGAFQVSKPASPTPPSAVAAVTAPTSPTSPSDVAAVTSPTSPSDVAAVTSPTSPSDVASVTSPTSPSDVASVTSPTSPSDVASVTSPTSPSDVASVTSPTSPSDVAAVTSPTSPSDVATVTPTTSPSDVATVTPTTSPSDIASVQPTTPPDSPTSPTSPSNLNLEFIAERTPEGNVVVSFGSQQLEDFVKAVQGASFNGNADLAGGASISSLNVTDSSQQYLSSFVNVNAVESAINIQLNVLVINNSNVGSVNSSNTINVSSLLANF